MQSPFWGTGTPSRSAGNGVSTARSMAGLVAVRWRSEGAPAKRAAAALEVPFGATFTGPFKTLLCSVQPEPLIHKALRFPTRMLPVITVDAGQEA